MQIVLRHLVTKLFLHDDWTWVLTPLEARRFESPLTAYHFAKANAFADVEVVILLPDGRLGGSLPVS